MATATGAAAIVCRGTIATATSLCATTTATAIAVRRCGVRVEIEVSANAFLHHMVRNIAGTLLAVGVGDRPVAWVAEVLAGRDRTVAGPTAVARGLYFAGVDYDARYGLPSVPASFR